MAKAKEQEVKKTECAISRDKFRAKAPAGMQVTINGTPFTAVRKEFSTGSFGWNVSDKLVVEIDGVPVKCQVGLNLTVVGSKDAK